MSQQFDHIPDFFEVVGDDLVKAIRRNIIIMSIVAIVAGVCLLAWPGHTLAVVAVILGLYFIVDAIVRLVALFRIKGISDGWRVLQILLSILLLVAGILVLRAPVASGAWLSIYLTILIGISWILEGMMSFATAAAQLAPGWSIFYGLLSIIAGVVVLASPIWSAEFFIIFAGVSLIVLGVSAAVRAFAISKSLN